MPNRYTRERQVEIINTFPSLGNLIGVVIKPKDSDNAQESILYVDKTGKYIISGALITPDSLNYLIEDMFETITLYQNRIVSTESKKLDENDTKKLDQIDQKIKYNLEKELEYEMKELNYLENKF